MNVSIRPWQLSDAANIAAIINNKELLDNLRDGIPFPYTEKDGVEFITAMLNAEQDSTYAFAIIACGKVAGSIGAFRQANIHRRTAELGYYVGEGYWGKGVCTTAVRLLCDYIFANTDIIRIYAKPFAYNAASCRVLEKSGFQFEGILRSNAVKNGKIIDMKMYLIIKPPVIRPLNLDDIPAAMDMVWNVFSEFIAPDYIQEGIDEFKSFIEPALVVDKMSRGEFRASGAFDGEKIVGIIAIRPPLHIALFSIDGQYHNQGIGRKLFETVLNDTTIIGEHENITVNASPYAVKIYQRLGFIPTDAEQTQNGMRFTPMECLLIDKR